MRVNRASQDSGWSATAVGQDSLQLTSLALYSASRSDSLVKCNPLHCNHRSCSATRLSEWFTGCITPCQSLCQLAWGVKTKGCAVTAHGIHPPCGTRSTSSPGHQQVCAAAEIAQVPSHPYRGCCWTNQAAPEQKAEGETCCCVCT